MRSRFAAFLLASAAALPLSADNLLQNPGFTSDLSGWTVESYSTGAWDRKSHATPGSVLLTSAATNAASAPNASIEQCVPVSAGWDLAFGASLWIPAGVAPGAEVTALLDVRFYTNTSCTSVEIGQVVVPASPSLRDTWIDVQGHSTAPPGSLSAKVAFAAVDFAGSSTSETVQVYVDDAYLLPGALCATTGSHLCLGERFLMWGSWSVPSRGETGYMRAVPMTFESGLFWFFSETNLEIFAKVLNACSDPYNHYWVFASGLTSVETSLWVLDTVSGQTWSNFHAAGTPFPPVLDTSAFATCP